MSNFFRETRIAPLSLASENTAVAGELRSDKLRRVDLVYTDG